MAHFTLDTAAAAPARQRVWLAVAAFALSPLALVAPWMAHAAPRERVGLLLIVAAVLEATHGFRRSTPGSQRAAWTDSAITFAMGVLLVNAPWLAANGLLIFLAGWFALDAVRRGVSAARQWRAGQPASASAMAAVGNFAVSAALLLLGESAATWAVAIAGALRIAGTGLDILRAPAFVEADWYKTVVEDLGLAGRKEIDDLARSIEEDEAGRVQVDRGWLVAFVATLFAIHLSRTGLDRSFLGLLTPGLAVVGDLVVALGAAYAVIVPIDLAWRRITRRSERRLWSWCLGAPGGAAGWPRRAARAFLSRRLRLAIRLRQARYSLRAALERGLQIGLPVAAIVAATAPVFGMSWYFDTENWAAGIWNSWAEERTDTWRAAMIKATSGLTGQGNAAFTLRPDGVAGGADFSFIVIGDTGEGDPSQHVLRDRYLDVVRKDEVRFVVLSSDVVYPVGAMKDYETKFWLPFKGTHKPVYAIPGNHDWYDALEAFNATFLQPDAARAAIRARIAVDNGLTTTTDARVEELVAKASRLRREYEVPTQFQQAPFFQVRTDRFALIAVDTGVARTLDPEQLAWLRRALDASRGKLIMAVIGHPFFAGGSDTVGESKEFGALRELLREHAVDIVMAGDTHDFEYYAERQPGSARTVHNFVNGGGGAYLSFGTALEWPAQPPTRDWAYYPTTADVIGKINTTTPWWKAPLWWWTRRFNAWPFSAEWLSAAFDVNVSPFFQSFVEVAVEPSANRVRLMPHGIHGRLRWSDLQASSTLRPPGVRADAFAEWIVDLPGTRN